MVIEITIFLPELAYECNAFPRSLCRNLKVRT